MDVYTTGFPRIFKNYFPYFFNTFSILNLKSSIPSIKKSFEKFNTMSFFEILNHETQFYTLHNTAQIL